MQAKKGGLKDTLADDMIATVLKATIDRTGVNPAVSIACGMGSTGGDFSYPRQPRFL